LEFLAEVTQHIPDKGEHLVRYYGWYSHRQRGIRKKARQADQAESGKLSIDRSAAQAQPSAAEGVRIVGPTRATAVRRTTDAPQLSGSGKVS
jgi:hypothetical protein